MLHLLLRIWPILIMAISSIAALTDSLEADSTEMGEKRAELPGAAIKGPFTAHFHEWLKENNYHVYDFPSEKLGSQASFGGREHARQKVKRRPVLFIHGNSDGALAEGSEEWAQGWSASIEHFLAKGYSSAELYSLTYGDRDLGNSLRRSMDCQTLVRLRRFVEAVLQYTQAEKLDIVAHSMGVTLARHLIQGRGWEELARKKDSGEEEQHDLDQCYLGPSLRHKVHTLMGIAGANYGLCLCADERLAETAPACSKQTGFWAGSGCPDSPIDECHLSVPVPHRSHCHARGKYAKMLHRLNAPEKPKDAQFVVSLWSTADAITGPTNFAWGRLTSLIPNSDHSAIYSAHSHHSIKWMTVRDQFDFISEQSKKLLLLATKEEEERERLDRLDKNESLVRRRAGQPGSLDME